MSLTIADTPARYTALLVEHLTQQGVDCTRALALVGINPSQLQQHGAMLSSPQRTAVVRLLGDAQDCQPTQAQIAQLVSVGEHPGTPVGRRRQQLQGAGQAGET